MEDDHHLSLIELDDAILKLETNLEVKKFFADLCTPAEIRAMSERWKVCQLLDSGELSYREIQKITKASLTTIGRVARFLNEEQHHGYKIILERR
jgi:TrpR-related protein YerC/YecD